MFSACGGVDLDGNNGGNTDIDGGNDDSGDDNGQTPSNPDDGNGGNGQAGFVETVIDGVTYTPNQNNTYTVTAVDLQSTTLTIEQTVNGVNVTEIGKDAVRAKGSLLKVVLPQTVKTIGENAFLSCKKLKDINLSNIEHIGKNAFNGAITTTNTEIDLSSLKTMGDAAFSGATYLRVVDMETATLTEIPEKAFFGCARLFTVTLPESVKIIRKQAFAANSCLVNVNLDKVERFKDNCFSECVNLLELTLTSVIEIREQAFFQCTKLSSVTVGDNIEVLYLRAFYSNYALNYFKMGNLDEHWWWYHVSANAYTSDEINKDFWVTNDGASNETLKDPTECAAFLLRSRNVGVFICAESWVMARGYRDSQNFPHRTHMLED
jgi:hypothetical protein